jgi:sulfopyruvate decarboxylase subunit alpha
VSRTAGGYAVPFVEALKSAGISIVTALPDSLLKEAYSLLATDPDIRYVPVTNEAEMPGIVAGAYLGGKRGVMVMENSGLRQLCEPLARFSQVHHVPLVMIMTFRGDFGEPFYWGHTHAQSMEPLLQALRIPYRVVTETAELKPMVMKGWVHAETSQWPVALVLSGDCVEERPYATT